MRRRSFLAGIGALLLTPRPRLLPAVASPTATGTLIVTAVDHERGVVTLSSLSEIMKRAYPERLIESMALRDSPFLRLVGRAS